MTSTPSKPPGAAQSVGACPICRRTPSEAYRPFCSRRCSDVDLQRWFSGAYAIPAVETGDPDPDGEISQ